MSVVGCDDSFFFEILKGPVVASFFHVEKLFAIPAIKVDGLYERVDDTILTVFACAIEAEVDTEMNRSPFRILFLTV